MGEQKKPALGAMPKWRHDELRALELSGAIDRNLCRKEEPGKDMGLNIGVLHEMTGELDDLVGKMVERRARSERYERQESNEPGRRRS